MEVHQQSVRHASQDKSHHIGGAASHPEAPFRTETTKIKSNVVEQTHNFIGGFHVSEDAAHGLEFAVVRVA